MELSKYSLKARLYPFAETHEEGTRAYVEDDRLCIETPGEMFDMKEKELSLPGRHNLYNSMAAGISARILEIRKDKVREALSDFKGVEHRLEKWPMCGGCRLSMIPKRPMSIRAGMHWRV